MMMKLCQTLQKESTQERERHKETKGQTPKSKQANMLKRGGPQGGKGTTKNQTLHQ
jgi:hypothetical protein